MKAVFKVCIPNTHRHFFDYHAEKIEPCVGARVWVPFRQKNRIGIIISKNTIEKSHPKTKAILDIIDDHPFVSSELLALCLWVSDYYQSPLSEIIPLALPKKYRDGSEKPPPTSLYYQLVVPTDQAYEQLNQRTPQQRALIDFFATHPRPLAKKKILQAGFKTAQLNQLLKKDILSTHLEAEKPLAPAHAIHPPLTLNKEQTLVVNTILNDLNRYHCFLLQGVTGSGKTEVYLQIIEQVLALDRQVLIIVPEIGLTPQLLNRFQKRFHEPMVVIHSNLSDTKRQQAWLWAKNEAVKLIIGTRGAIFTPLPALGLIVIDEEHDASLKQMEGVRYSARDTALMRAYVRHIPIILGSATPSLESLHNCTLQKYTLLRLNQKAMNSLPLRYEILDIRNQVLQHGLATATLSIIKEHLTNKHQVLVFINRRGFAPVLLCHQCGWIADCHACDAHLTIHRKLGRLICHHCGATKTIPKHCDQCQTEELQPIGAGTQRIHEFLITQFPSTTILRIDRDEVRKKNALNQCLDQINDGNAELIVGTQMLAKGHHFPRLTLVVILETDNGFYNQDFRALEHLGQLLTQVAGRAGRAEHPGQIVIQTHLPQHPLLNLLIQQGYDAFAQSLLKMRQKADLPPYQFLSVIRAQGKTLPNVLQFLHTIKEKLQPQPIKILGPAPAPLARKGGTHRMQLLIKSPSRKQLKLALTEIRDWLMDDKRYRNIRWNIDVDPIDLS